MKIGIFDSGLGGLIITKSIIEKLPQYDIVYLGDTKRVPYGDRSEQEIYKFAKQAIDFLFRENCKLVIVACNTVSANALRKIQQQHVPKKYPDRKVLGVIIPTVEVASKQKVVGILTTASTARSQVYSKELKKLNKEIGVYHQAAPKLVPMIESDSLQEVDQVLKVYLQSLNKQKIDSLILGCTHYPILKKHIKKILGSKVKIYDQTQIIPQKLRLYLKNHPEINNALTKKYKRTFYVTKNNDSYKNLTKRLMGRSIKLQTAKL